jgi:hypothetical protein
VLHHILHRHDPGSGAELVDGHQELLVRLEEELQGVAHRDGLGDEVDLLHQAADGLEVLIVGLGLEQVAPADKPDDVVEVFLVHRDAGKRDVGVLAENLADRGRLLEGRDDGARRHDFTDADIVERQGVGNDVRLAGGQGALLGALFREEDDLAVGGGRARRAAHRQAHRDLAEPDDGQEHPPGPAERINDHRLQARAVDHAEILRNHLGDHEDGEGERRGEHADRGGAEPVGRQDADDHRAESVGDGVEREDGRDGFVEIVLQPLEQPAARGLGPFEGLDLRHRGAEHDGLGERAGERHAERAEDGGDQPEHEAETV